MKKVLLSLFLAFSLTSTIHAEEMPDLTFKDINGNTIAAKGSTQGIDIPTLKGKIVFLEFFGHQCPPCLMSIPHMIDIQKKHADKLAVIAVEVQGLTTEQLKTFTAEKGMNYTVASQSDADMLTNYIAARAQWNGSIPFTVAMNAKGEVQFVQAGMLPPEYLEELFTQLSKQ